MIRSLTIDTVCECGHWYEEHDVYGGPCTAPHCQCQTHLYASDLNTPEAIADRAGGEHDRYCGCAFCQQTRETR